jgi:hypothetical protein
MVIQIIEVGYEEDWSNQIKEIEKNILDLKEMKIRELHKLHLQGYSMNEIAKIEKCSYNKIKANFDRYKLEILPYKKRNPISNIQREIRNSSLMKNWRKEIFERDKYTCQDCSKKGCYLEAHHIKEFSKLLKENDIRSFPEAQKLIILWDINNGITLCKDCHDNKYLLYGKQK